MFVILGPASVQVNDEDVPLGSGRQRALLALLLFHLGENVSIDRIVDHLWPGSAVSSRRRTLHEVVSRARAVLRDVDGHTELHRCGAAYRLVTATRQVDYHYFRELVASARRILAEDPERAADTVTLALQLWRGRPLAELSSAEAELLRDRMRERYLEGMRTLIDAHLAANRPEPALHTVEMIIDEQTVDSGLAHAKVRALLELGRRDEAAVFARKFHREYHREMGAPPDLDLLALIRRDRQRLANLANGALDSRFGPPAAATSITHSPPRQIRPRAPRLIGRDESLVALDNLVERMSARTILLTGMPGVGKTTLATHWGHQHADRYPDGQLYLDLQGHGPGDPVNPGDALGRLLGALGVPPSLVPADTDQRHERYDQALYRKRVLIILDNVRDSDHVRPLLTNAVTCLTIVISRNRTHGLLHSDSTLALSVEPLDAEQSEQLLDHLAHTGTDPAHRQTDGLRALARLSGGLPLALSIIGAYVNDRPGIDLADLADNLATELLDRDVDDSRDITLRTVFNWSYQALEPGDARLFRTLGLFPGATISTGAATALLGENAARGLDKLIRANLVKGESARYHSVHDLLRRYTIDLAATDLSNQERRDARHRLFNWYLHTAAAAAALLAPNGDPVPDMPTTPPTESQRFDTAAAALAWIDAERPNLLAVVRAATTTGMHRYAWQIAANVHQSLSRRGRLDEVLDLLHCAATAAVADAHDHGHVGTMLNIAATHFAMHDYRRSAEVCAEALRLAREKKLPNCELAGLHNLGSAYLKAGEPARAVPLLDEVLDAVTRAGFLPGQAATLISLGDARRALRQHDAAATCYHQAHTLFERINEPRGQGRAQIRLAELQLALDDPERALRYCTTALAIYERFHDDTHHSDAMIIAADAHRMLGHQHDAQHFATDALTLCDTLGDLHRRAKALAVLADSLAATGDRAGALTRCEQALAITAELTDPEARTVHQRLHATAAALG